MNSYGYSLYQLSSVDLFEYELEGFSLEFDYSYIQENIQKIVFFVSSRIQVFKSSFSESIRIRIVEESRF